MDSRVQCLVCERRCRLAPGQTGYCQTRRNIDGVLHTLIYGDVSSLSANPIEKKPLYHFYPGTVALTAGSWGCNFACPWCQNWNISKRAPSMDRARYISPERFVGEALRLGCQGTSISFNEPTLLLEWSVDVFELARQKGLYNTFVTNGYMTREALALLIDAGLDAMNVDLKGDNQSVRRFCAADMEPVWRNCRDAQDSGVHLEVTTLVIPGVNDSNDSITGLAERIVQALGPDTPWHLSAYYPAYRFTAPPTPVKTLEQAREIGRRAGLRYVYLGNVPGHRYENTFCSQCGGLMIRRFGLKVTGVWMVKGRCPACGTTLPGAWAWPG